MVENAVSDKVTLTIYDERLIDPTIIPKITILDAINFVDEAWDCVKTQTIISSWTRTDILPVSASSIPVACVTDKVQEVERGIKDLSQRLPIDEPMDVQEYIDRQKCRDLFFY